MRIGLKDRWKNLFRKEILIVGKECEFGDIKVGEVFAKYGCWDIYYKISPRRALVLADDIGNDFEWDDIGNKETFFSYEECCKLSPKIQSLWRSR